jgi:hypothetical protein
VLFTLKSFDFAHSLGIIFLVLPKNPHHIQSIKQQIPSNNIKGKEFENEGTKSINKFYSHE